MIHYLPVLNKRYILYLLCNVSYIALQFCIHYLFKYCTAHAVCTVLYLTEHSILVISHIYIVYKVDFTWIFTDLSFIIIIIKIIIIIIFS